MLNNKNFAYCKHYCEIQTHIVRLVAKSNRTSTETEAQWILLTHIYMTTQSTDPTHIHIMTGPYYCHSPRPSLTVKRGGHVNVFHMWVNCWASHINMTLKIFYRWRQNIFFMRLQIKHWQISTIQNFAKCKGLIQGLLFVHSGNINVKLIGFYVYTFCTLWQIYHIS